MIPQDSAWLFHHPSSYITHTVLWCMWFKFVPKQMNKSMHVMDHWSLLGVVKAVNGKSVSGVPVGKIDL